MASKPKTSDGRQVVEPGAGAKKQDRLPDSMHEEEIRRRAYEIIWSAAESPAMTSRIGFRRNASSRTINPRQPPNSAAGKTDGETL